MAFSPAGGAQAVRTAGALAMLAGALLPSPAGARAEVAAPMTPQALVYAMLAREAAPHTDHYEYLSEERSDRTGGHLWTERVIETGEGKVRRLIAEDGKPLSEDRARAEQTRLDAIAADPGAFTRLEAAQKSDEQHARQMLASLPKGFILEHVALTDGVWRVEFRPDPEYSPAGMEEHVLHGMSGWFSIDARSMRLTHIEGRLAQDVNMGFGLINIHAGSNFASDRADEDGRWRTTMVHSDIRGRALMFKTISKSTDLHRSDFHYLDANVTIPQAVERLEK